MKQIYALLKLAILLSVLLSVFTVQAYASEAMTREDFSALVVEFYEDVTGGEITERTSFIDTEDVNVEKAAAIGAVTGVGEGRFAPGSLLTREQVAVIIVRLAEALDKPMTRNRANFADNNYISPWAVESVGRAQGAGIIRGTGGSRFSPRDSFTFEQGRFVMQRFYDYMNTTEIIEQDVPLGNATLIELMELVNIERSYFGLTPLGTTDAMHAAAALRSYEVSITFSHSRPDGSSCFTVFRELNIVSRAHAENIAGNFTTAERVVNAWMNSPDHRRHILNPIYTVSGVGIYVDSLGRSFWVQLFSD